MSRVAYVNGLYCPLGAASIHIEDRGYQFSDAVYEVILVASGKLIDCIAHLDRLDRSLGEVQMLRPLSRKSWRIILEEMINRNRLKNGILYIQVSRGVAPRDHVFPQTQIDPALVVTAKRLDFDLMKVRQREGVPVITATDIRWGRPDIKSTSLLANVLAKEEARKAGAYECWLLDKQGYITEGTASNAWIVRNDILVTRNTGHSILSGVTRNVVLQIARDLGLAVEERPFMLEEAKKADEAFMTGTTTFVTPVTTLDGEKIASGAPGPVTEQLRDSYWAIINGQSLNAA